MAKSWQYSPWRRQALQAVMGLILLATVGMAALVTRQKQLAIRVPLGEPVKTGDISIGMPAGWAVSRPQSATGNFDKIQALERPGDEKGRSIIVTREQLPMVISSLEYLFSTRNVPGH